VCDVTRGADIQWHMYYVVHVGGAQPPPGLRPARAGMPATRADDPRGAPLERGGRFRIPDRRSTLSTVTA